MTRDDLITQHLHLVPITRQRCYPVPPARIAAEDLESEGYIGLVKAADRFDPARGVQFRSFAISCIRRAMAAYLRSADWITRHGREKYRRTGEAPPELLSLEEVFETQGGDPSPGPEALATAAVERQEIRQRLARLPVRERRVMAQHWWGKKTLAAIGEELGKSESRAQQIKQEGSERLRTEAGSATPFFPGWNEHTDAILRDLFPDYYASDIADILGCNKATVYKRVRALGLDKEKETMVEAPTNGKPPTNGKLPTNGQHPEPVAEKSAPFHPNITKGGRPSTVWHPWRADEDETILSQYRQRPTREIAADLGRTEDAIRNRVKMLRRDARMGEPGEARFVPLPTVALDPEVAAMQALAQALTALDAGARGRVLRWAQERWQE